jgi:hypothetical protein
MGFQEIYLYARTSTGQPAPAILETYCAYATEVPPRMEYFLGDPEYDWQTLASSAGYRDQIVRLSHPHSFGTVHVHWNRADHLHELSPNGDAWVKSMGTGMRFPVTIGDFQIPENPQLYVAIRFGEITSSTSAPASGRNPRQATGSARKPKQNVARKHR